MQMGSLMLRWLRFMAQGSITALLLLVGAYVVYLDSRPTLQPWHVADLDEEFTSDSSVDSLADYLSLETRLFDQLDREVHEHVPDPQRTAINRYARGSLADPVRWTPNWNRTFELRPDAQPKCAVLLLHGMSDSPYSLRSLGQRLTEEGAYVLGLRMPGHGTAPTGLVDLTPADMQRAVRIGMQHAAAESNGMPIFVIGYSTGAALAVLYALESLEDASLPAIDGMVLLSPAIGVDPIASLAVWQARLGHLLGLDKVAWNTIQPEYDPFKYGSFPVNAGDVVYRLTTQIKARIDAATAAGSLTRLPPILAFSSVVDATVSTSALVRGLFGRLPQGGHELVLFDVNRAAAVQSILANDPAAAIEALRQTPGRSFTLDVITNASPETMAAVLRSSPPGRVSFVETDIGSRWPEDVYSLSHVALPFPKDDPLYGGAPRGDNLLRLGNVALRGERGALLVSATDMLRQRWNPFHAYMVRRMLAFLQSAPAARLGNHGSAPVAHPEGRR